VLLPGTDEEEFKAAAAILLEIFKRIVTLLGNISIIIIIIF